jgi:hypothetical protein
VQDPEFKPQYYQKERRKEGRKEKKERKGTSIISMTIFSLNQAWSGTLSGSLGFVVTMLLHSFAWELPCAW